MIKGMMRRLYNWIFEDKEFNKFCDGRVSSGLTRDELRCVYDSMDRTVYPEWQRVPQYYEFPTMLRTINAHKKENGGKELIEVRCSGEAQSCPPRREYMFYYR